jgi:hypothetical protein
MNRPLALIENQENEAQPFFPNETERQRFYARFSEKMKTELKAVQKERFESEKKARRNWIG